MTTTVLNLHAGGHEVSYDELAQISAPEPTKTWNPIRHATVLDTAKQTLTEAGFLIRKERLAISHNGARFFGTLDLATALSPDGTITLAVGLRNSIDKTFPMGFAAGSRVFVCSNLAFSAELMVRRKHTTNGIAHFSRDISASVLKLDQFREAETARIAALQTRELTDHEAESYILRSAVYRGIIPLRLLNRVTEEWRSPHHDEFKPRTAWSLVNAFTGVLGDMQTRNPHELAVRTMRLHSLLAN